MAIRYGRGDVKQTTAGFRGPLMVQSLTSAKSKFLSLPLLKANSYPLTRNAEELCAMVGVIKNMKPGAYRNPIPRESSLLDPYRDGKAIERFRNLLVSRCTQDAKLTTHGQTLSMNMHAMAKARS
jgi:hypothetical protein